MTFDKIRIFQESRETLKDLDITLEEKSAKENIYIESVTSKRRSRPRQLRESSINTGHWFSFETDISQLQKSTCAHYRNPVVRKSWEQLQLQFLQPVISILLGWTF